jgi:hypothetical protein
MSRADEIRAKAARVAARQVPTAEPTPVTVSPPLARSVRSTLDLNPTMHRDLQVWITESSTVLGRARLTKQDVLTALVARLLADKAFAASIINDLRSGQ